MGCFVSTVPDALGRELPVGEDAGKSRITKSTNENYRMRRTTADVTCMNKLPLPLRCSLFLCAATTTDQAWPVCVLCVGRTTKENLGGKTDGCIRKWNVYERWKPNRTRLTRRRDKAKSRANRSHVHRKLTPGALWRTPSVPLLLRNEFPEAPGTSVGGCTFLPKDYQARRASPMLPCTDPMEACFRLAKGEGERGVPARRSIKGNKRLFGEEDDLT